MGMCKLLFKDATKIQHGYQRLTPIVVCAQKLQKLKSEIIQILLSHSPREPIFFHIVQSRYTQSGNMHVILLKFKMATTNRLLKYL